MKARCYRLTKSEVNYKVYVEKADNIFYDKDGIEANGFQFDQVAGTRNGMQGLIGHAGNNEGQTIFKDLQEDKWYLFLDSWPYHVRYTTDLEDGPQLVNNLLDSSEYALPPGPRHGTVIPITRAEYDALQAKYGYAGPEEAADPVVHYTFDPDSVNGTTVADASGNGHDARLVGGALINDQDRIGEAGGAVELDGTSGYVELPENLIHDLNLEKATISAWVKMDEDRPNQRIFDFASDTGRTVNRNTMYVSTKGDSGGLEFAVVTPFTEKFGSESTLLNANYKYALRSERLSANEWNHVAVTLDGFDAVLYVNGEEAARSSTFNVEPRMLLETTMNYIGKSRRDTHSLFDGKFDDFRIYNRALLADEIVTLADNTPIQPVAVTGVSLDKSEITLKVNEEVRLTAAVAPADASNKAVTWSSSNEDAAVVDADGLVKAAGAGTAEITVTTVDGGYTASALVTVEAEAVTPNEVTDVTLKPGDQKLELSWKDPKGIVLKQVKLVVSEGKSVTDTVYAKAGAEYAVIDNLKNGTAYDIAIRTIDAEGNESSGVTVEGTPAAAPEADTTPPGEVTNPRVAAGSGQLTFTWTDPTDQDLARIKISGHGSTVTESVYADKGAESYTYAGLNNGTKYEFLITTVDMHGNESAGIVVEGTPAKPSDPDPVPTPGPTPTPSPGPTPAPAPTPAPGQEDPSSEAKPEVTADGVVVQPAVGSGGRATVKLSEDSVKSAREQTTSGRLRIKVEAAEGMNELEVNIPVEQLLTDEGTAINRIEVESDLATVTVSTKRISQASSTAKHVTISIRKADLTSLSAETQERLKDAVVYNFNLSVEGVKISEFDGRSDVTVAIPYELKPGEHPNKVVIYYVNNSGELEVVTNGRYNAASGKVEFKPKHFSTYAAAYANASFKDVTKAWAKEAVEALAARGVVSGMGEGRFNPEGQVTRAEFITMLMNLFELTDPYSSTSLSDVKAGAWYYEEIATAYQLGIIGGRPDGSFGVNEAVTRQDMAVMAYKAARYAQLELRGQGEAAAFADAASISPYAEQAVKAMQTAGVINGMGNGEFAPKAYATRAQAAVIIHKLLELL
ncbi:S-layer homology domain-containing protein [Paenibacillus sambharensis]|nr:S-layer homology domain-containing protein [Paenibacillus sambharensis]